VTEFKALFDQAEKNENSAMAAKVSRLLLKHGKTVAVAESMTGGLLSQKLTMLPDSSQFFVGGVVCYHPRIKVQYCGVDPKTIASDGVVSEAVAMALASGIKKRFATDLGISVTGAAGPNPHGGAAVGTVWVGISAAEETKAKRFFFKGTRSEIQMAAAEAALSLIWIHFGELEI
jgi:PncC family amidohydrolase